MKKTLSKILFGIFVSLSFLIGNSFAEPLSAKWYTRSFDVVVGDEVKINLFVSPREDSPVYTISNTLMYDPGLLDFVSADFEPEWFVLSEDPNSLTDTENGMIRRTGGIAKGFNYERKYITYVFKAKNPGVAKLNLEDGLVFNAENENIGLQNKNMSINILPAPVNVEAPAEDENKEDKPAIPLKISEINLNYDLMIEPAIREGQDYQLFIPLDQKLKDSNDGNVQIVVYNDLREVVYNANKSFSKGETSSLLFILPDFILKPGNYFVNVKILYKDDLKMFTTEKRIGVLPTDRTWVDIYKVQLFTSFLFIFMIACLYHLHYDHVELKKLRRRFSKQR